MFTPLRSDIMGPFRFLPGMECSHGVISMGHSLEGKLDLNGKRIDFSGGTGYVETDRGRSFPSAYLWTQCTVRQPDALDRHHPNGAKELYRLHLRGTLQRTGIPPGHLPGRPGGTVVRHRRGDSPGNVPLVGRASGGAWVPSAGSC